MKAPLYSQNIMQLSYSYMYLQLYIKMSWMYQVNISDLKQMKRIYDNIKTFF